MLNQTELNTIKTKDKIEHYLLVTSISLKTTKAGKEFLDVNLRDKSIELNAKMWDNFEQFYSKAKVGDVVKILGSMDEFNNQPQIRIDRIRFTVEKDNVSPSDFLPNSEIPITEMETRLKNRIEQITDKNLVQLLKKILNEEKFYKYKKVPAGKAWHHAYIGGLIEHTLELIKICDLMCDIHKELNRDLLITGAILHDLGKIEELSFETGFNYTDKGKLVGHIVIIANIIEKETAEISDFPEELKNELLHLVLSHQGKLEYASPVIPKTLEAIVLYHADELSAKTNAYKGAILNEADREGNWTRFLKLAETDLYIPKRFTDDEFKETLF